VDQSVWFLYAAQGGFPSLPIVSLESTQFQTVSNSFDPFVPRQIEATLNDSALQQLPITKR